MVDLLSSQLPLDVGEVQALVEAKTVVERAESLRAVLEIAVPAGRPTVTTRH